MFTACSGEVEDRNQPKIVEAVHFTDRHPFWPPILARFLWARAATLLSSKIVMRFLFLESWIFGKPELMMENERVVGRCWSLAS